MGANNDGGLSKEELYQIKGSGFDRLSACDGSSVGSIKAVKNFLGAPDSFEHIKTRATPVSSSGTHSVFMEYRDPNGFGGMNVGTATGSYRNLDCSHTILSIE